MIEYNQPQTRQTVASIQYTSILLQLTPNIDRDRVNNQTVQYVITLR